MTRYDRLRREFLTFDVNHPEVWQLFQHFTFDRLERGFRRYSADAICHRIRFETDKPDYGESRKPEPRLTNNHVAFYARKFLEAYPQHKGFFVVRYQRSMDIEEKEGPAEGLVDPEPDITGAEDPD